MPPKRSRAAGTPGPISASQPEPQRSGPTTRNRKRRHSDASNVSDASEISTSSKTKRPTRQTTIEEEVIKEADEPKDEGEDPACDETPGKDMDAPLSKRVKFNTSNSDNDNDNTFTAQHITPHPGKKMTIKKRRTLSPVKRSVKRLSRTSLPPSLSQDGQAPSQVVGSFTFSPLSSVLGDRIRVRKLSFGDGRRIEDEDEDAGDETLVLDNYEENKYAQLNTSLAPVVLQKQGDTTPTRKSNGWDEEREQLSNAVIALQREANDAKANLSVLRIQLESIGFGNGEEGDPDGPAAKSVLANIRASFEEARAFLDRELPGIPDNASNSDLLTTLKDTVQDFANRLRNANKEAIDSSQLTSDLAIQVDSLLTRVADEKLRNGQLRKDHSVAIERFKTSLENYAKEQTRLLELITRMEEDHSSLVANMNKEREGTVRNLETQLDGANEAREDLQGRVGSLETNLEQVEQDLESLRHMKDTEKQQRIEAEAANDAANEDLDAANAQNEDLSNKLRELGKEANGLRAKIYELQNKNQTLAKENADRVKVFEDDLQAELNERARLKLKLDETEARMKDLLQGRDERIAALEDEVAQKDAEIQSAEEEFRASLERKDSDISELRGTISDFESTIHDTQEEASTYKALAEEYEATNAGLNDQISDLNDQISDLKDSEKGLEERVEKEAMHVLTMQNEFHNEIDRLKAEILQHNQKIATITKKRDEENAISEQVIEAKKEELLNFEVSSEHEINMLQGQLDNMTQQFRAFINHHHERIVQQQNLRNRSLAALDEEDEALKEELMNQLSALEVPQTNGAATNGAAAKGAVANGAGANGVVTRSQHQQRNSVKKVHRKKRLVDSGIGLDVDEEMVETA